MTDKVNKPQNVSNFSFRMFDLYRRFVEVLQLNPDFLEDFKSGVPKDEVCRFIIKNTFLFRQSEEKIVHLIKYLCKNAKTIAAHAENVPDNWNDAIKYTDTCIKLIRKYLRRKGISIKTDLDSEKQLAEDIGECMHGTPNERQIEAIREYLKYDLRNPKKTVVNTSKKSKVKKVETKKSTKALETDENSDMIEVKQNNVDDTKNISDEASQIKNKKNLNDETLQVTFQIMDEEKRNQESIQVALQIMDEEVKNESLEVTNEKKVYEELLKTADMNESQEGLLSKSILQTLLGTDNLKSQNDLLHIEDSKNSVEEQKEILSEFSDEVTIYANKSTSTEYAKSLLNHSIKYECPEEEYMIIEINEKLENVVNEESRQGCEIIDSNESPTNYCLKLKRKNLSFNEDDHKCVKKLYFSNDELNTQDDQYITISYTTKQCEFETVQIPEFNTIPENESVQINDDNDSSNIEINVVDDDDECEIKFNVELSNQESNTRTVKHEQEKEEKVLIENKNKLEYKDDKSFSANLYSSVGSMTYTEVFKLMETIMAFCELRNEISLEEYLVLRRTRDKMQWKSLKEIKKKESSET